MSMFVELDGWRAKLRFSACHFIPDHPSCGCLHGHTFAVSIRLTGELENEFVVDFIELKTAVRSICDELDHRVLIASNDSRLKVEVGERECEVLMKAANKRYVLPREDVVLLPTSSVSSEALCTYIAEKLREHLSPMKNLSELSVRVDEGAGQGAGCTIMLD